MKTQRYTRHPLPHLRYIPGWSVHPSKDPQRQPVALNDSDAVLSTQGFSSQTFLYGVDLFNHGFWWEAHEMFEEIWLKAGRETATGAWVQGLIFLCGVMVKMHTGQRAVATGFLQQAESRFHSLPAPAAPFEPQHILQQVRSFAEKGQPVLPQIDLKLP